MISKNHHKISDAPYFFQTLPEFVQVEANVEAVLPCPISGEPKPEITWTKVNSNLPSKRILGSNGELRIPQMNPEDQVRFFAIFGSGHLFWEPKG